MLARASSRADRLALALQQLSSRATAPHVARIDRLTLALRQIASGITTPRRVNLEKYGATLAAASSATLSARRNRIEALAQLLDALSPEATLRRGYSITRVGGHAVTDPSQVVPGDVLHTTLAGGTVTSIVE